MTVEFLLAIGIIIAITELKEHRLHKRFNQLSDNIELAEESLGMCNKALEALVNEIKLMNESMDLVKRELAESRQSHGSIHEKLDDLKVKSESVLKEFELNGAPIRPRPEGVDIIEGF